METAVAFRLQASGKKIEFKLKFSALNFLSNYPFLFSCISLEKQCPSLSGQNPGDQAVSLIRLEATCSKAYIPYASWVCCIYSLNEIQFYE